MPDPDRGTATNSATDPTAVQAMQRRRFWHHLAWSAGGSTLVALAVYLAFGVLWPTLSFLALMLVMSVFFAAYYALLRIE